MMIESNHVVTAGHEAARVVLVVLLSAALTAPPTPVWADKPAEPLAKYDRRIDAAVTKALAFLAKSQQPNGVFPSALGNNTAVTSLCVMAFLAKGHTPGCGPYGEVINNGIDVVLAGQHPNGMLVGKPTHGPMYSHAISTLMLSEVSGMVSSERQKRIDAALPRALRLLLDSQLIKKPALMQGGWRYQPTSADSDISCSGWSLMALRSARNAGAAVPKDAIDAGVKFIMNCRTPDNGFAYQPGSSSGYARTATALLCLELCGKHRDEAAIGAAEWILKHMPANYGGTFFYYWLYYASQGMFQIGGDYWVQFATRMYEMVLNSQQADGSWLAGSSHEAAPGVCYATAISVLAMSVTYRQLPIYQR